MRRGARRVGIEVENQIDDERPQPWFGPPRSSAKLGLVRVPKLGVPFVRSFAARVAPRIKKLDEFRRDHGVARLVDPALEWHGEASRHRGY